MKFYQTFQDKRKKSLIFLKKRGAELEWVSTNTAAKILGKTDAAVRYWCAGGSIFNMPFYWSEDRVTYSIPIAEVYRMKALLTEKRKARIYYQTIYRKVIRRHCELIKAWDQMMKYGLIDDTPYSDSTREMRRSYLEKFLQEYPAVSAKYVKDALDKIPKGNKYKKKNLWYSTFIFYKWLVQEGMGNEDELLKLRRIRPKRIKPKKKTLLSDKQMEKLYSSCIDPYERVLLILFSNTVISRKDFCKLMKRDIDFEKGKLNIVSKRVKTRLIPLNNLCIEALKGYLESNIKDEADWMFLAVRGKKLEPYSIQAKLNLIGDRAGIKINTQILKHTYLKMIGSLI